MVSTPILELGTAPNEEAISVDEPKAAEEIWDDNKLDTPVMVPRLVSDRRLPSDDEACDKSEEDIFSVDVGNDSLGDTWDAL